MNLRCDKPGCQNFASLSDGKHQICRRCFDTLVDLVKENGVELVDLITEAFVKRPLKDDLAEMRKK